MCVFEARRTQLLLHVSSVLLGDESIGDVVQVGFPELSMNSKIMSNIAWIWGYLAMTSQKVDPGIDLG